MSLAVLASWESSRFNLPAHLGRSETVPRVATISMPPFTTTQAQSQAATKIVEPVDCKKLYEDCFAKCLASQNECAPLIHERPPLA